MVMQTKQITAEAFDTFVLSPANRDRRLEYIAGEIIEVVSNSYSSETAMRIAVHIGRYLLDNDIGRLTGADGGYQIGNERYIPDVAFISYKKQPQPSHEPYNSNPPDLAIEVLSPSDDPADLRIKIVNYLRAGTAVWVFNPEPHQVEIYVPGQPPQILGLEDTIDGGDLLPGFKAAVKDIFPKDHDDGDAD